MRWIVIPMSIIALILAGFVGYRVIYVLPLLPVLPELTVNPPESIPPYPPELIECPIPFVETEKDNADLKLVLKCIMPTGNVRMDQYYFRRPKNGSDCVDNTSYGENGDGIGTNGSISASYGHYVTLDAKEEYVQIEISSYSIDNKEKKEHNIILEIPYMINNNLKRDGYSYEWSWMKMK